MPTSSMHMTSASIQVPSLSRLQNLRHSAGKTSTGSRGGTATCVLDTFCCLASMPQESCLCSVCRPGRQRLRRSRSRDGGRDCRGRSSSREGDIEDGERRAAPVPAPAHDATGVQLELTPRQSARRADLVLLLNTILATNQGQ